MTQFTFQPTDLWDNGYAEDLGDYYASSSMARAIFTTSARLVEVTFYASPDWLPHIGFRVNGRDCAAIAPQQAGINTIKCLLPKGKNKRVEIVAGSQTAFSSGGPIFTSNLISADFNAAAQLVPPASNNRLLIYGDSIAGGASAKVASLQSWASLLRQDYSGSVLVEQYGYRLLFNDCSDVTQRESFANKLAAFNPSKIWMAIGTNDYALNAWNSASAFGTAYVDFLDKLHILLPTVKIYCQSLLIRNPESANFYGNTPDDFRTIVQNITTTRPWTTFVNGKAIINASQLQDEVHPNIAGHLAYKNAVLAILNNT